jgi:dihydrofolate synthase/folylpolyglutamate synthase
MNYPDSVRFLYALGNELKTAKFGLERIARVMEELGNPHLRPARFVHVAGTNGKGSTCAMIESGLRAAGLRTGLYTSPHLLEPTERIRIDGQPVLSAEFTEAFDQVHRAAEELIERGEIDAHPSYFETVTAMAFLLFRQARVDITVLEVGLGGRLDATNIVEPELCAITPVDFDHEKFLGTSVESIAAEKAGILKPGVPVVLAGQRVEADRVIRRRARELVCDVIGVLAPYEVEVHPRYSRIVAHGLEIECPLAGRHQVVNALAAVTVLRQLGVSNEAIQTGIRTARWPGRLERLRERPEVIVDGAHNPAGARALAEYVAEFYAHPQPILIFGAMRDKALEEMAGILFPHFGEVVVTAPDQPRALDPETFLGLVDHPAMSAAQDLKSALARIPAQHPPLFISGSLFLVAEAVRLLG